MSPVSVLVFALAVLLYSPDEVAGQGFPVSWFKPAFQTSTADGAVASRAVDQDPSGTFSDGSCSSTGPDTNPTWWVDLGQEYLVHSVLIFNRQDCCKELLNPFNIRIGYSNDVLTNPQCGGDHNIDLNLQSVSVDCPMWGRYVAVTLPGSTRTLTMCEVIVTASVCPSGYDNRFGFNACLKGYSARKTYADAKLHCSEYGAKLFVLDNADRGQRLKGLMTAYRARTDGKRGVWIGLTDSDSEGNFNWDKDGGVPVGAYTDWAAGALDKNSPDRNCVQMKATKNYMWWVVNCEDKNAYICEKDVETPPPSQ